MLATLALPLPAPLSAHELREAVRQARPYNAARLDRVLRLDADRAQVEVQASAAWSSLAAYERPGMAEIAAAWGNELTIGQSIAANAPGPDGRPTVAHVEGLTLVTGDGDLRKVSRDCHPEIFALAVGGQGLIGTLYSATLRLESLACAAAEARPEARLDLPHCESPARPLHVLLPPENLRAFLDEARAHCAEWRLAIQGAGVRRTLPETETALCWAQREYAWVTLHLEQPGVLGSAVRTTQVRRLLIDTAIAHGGSLPISHVVDATRSQLERCYPKLKSFLAEKRRLDPGERLTNAWYREVRAVLASDNCEVRWTRNS